MTKIPEFTATENQQPPNPESRTDRPAIQGLQHEGKPLVEIGPDRFETIDGEISFTAVEIVQALNHKVMLTFMAGLLPPGENNKVTDEIGPLLEAPALLENKNRRSKLFTADPKSTNPGATGNQENQS